MEWIAKYYDNVYLLTDEELVFKDTVVYVSPEDKTMVIDHRSINNPVEGKPYKIVWCYEPGEKMAGPVTFTTRLTATTVAADLIPVQPMKPPELGNWFYETTGYQSSLQHNK